MISAINNIELSSTIRIDDAIFTVNLTRFPLASVDEYEETTKAFHQHVYLEMVYIKEPNGAIFETVKTSLKMAPNNLVIVSPHTLHRIINIENSKAFKIGITVKSTRSNSLLFNFIKFFNENIDYKVLNDKKIISILDNLDNYSEFFKINFEASFTLLILYLYKTLYHENYLSNQQADKQSVFDVKDSINNYLIYYYKNEISLEDLSKKIYLSTRQINRICKKIFDRSFKQQVTFLRIEHAKKLLTNTNLSITNIAYSVGYSNSSSFTNSFKITVGQLPKEFRNENKKY